MPYLQSVACPAGGAQPPAVGTTAQPYTAGGRLRRGFIKRVARHAWHSRGEPSANSPERVLGGSGS